MGDLNGQNLLLDKIFKKVLIQTNCIKAVNIIQNGSLRNSSSVLVRRIHQILERIEHWRTQHIPREENSVANSLAKSVCTRKKPRFEII